MDCKGYDLPTTDGSATRFYLMLLRESLDWVPRVQSGYAIIVAKEAGPKKRALSHRGSECEGQ